MYFDSLSDFFNMGGHALYVWSAFAISLLLMLLNIILPWWNFKATRLQLQRQLRREAKQQANSSITEQQGEQV
ncbi:heme exporter protein D [Marinospirillum celere]|uniref:Heme exporter protein D n=1 Tax=Marinospirillum celere TaxID=1122252 RepID=A0A1I1GZG5_9GAMM|nr:heme exporter protein CcmD [Marinospirillum celere]SFC16931.1 heme exporter protein D [Marinospirillum celere]